MSSTARLTLCIMLVLPLAGPEGATARRSRTLSVLGNRTLPLAVYRVGVPSVLTA